jgi:Spy/CpxP family protein refolding chaperone
LADILLSEPDRQQSRVDIRQLLQSDADDRAEAEAHVESCAEMALARDDLSVDTRAPLQEILERARLAKERMGAKTAP